ncbi:MAG: hypothetical protein LUD68_09350 [Rikenellaceae bacterium]|nr:hypothetical protein [Rikenellaceae bacterium]
MIYVPETPAGTAGALTGNPCLLINGTYKGTAGWYKAEFLDKDVSGGTDRLLPLLRNYRYNAVITGVGGRGYATAEEAYKSKAQNLIVELLYHQDASLTNVMSAGQNWLAWDPHRFELDKQKHDQDDTHNIFQIETNCEDGWRWTKTVDAGGEPVTWLTIPDADRSGAKGVRGKFRFLVDANPGPPRKAFVHFTAGRMDMSVEVVQSDESNLEILLFDVDDNPLGDVFWVNTVENKIQERTIRVKWTPEMADLSVTFATDNYPNAVQVKYETGRDIPAGTVSGDGLHEYHLKLSELTMADDYDFDAGMIQPYRTRYTFTLDYHGRQITKELVIAHHLEFFHLYRYQPEGYLMGLLNWDQSLCFEASAPFIAELSNNHHGLFTFYTGNYGNFTEGFHTNYEKGKEGYFEFYEWSVTAKNPTPERKLQYETISITFPESELPDTTIILKTFYILPNCYITPPGTSVQVPVRNP